MALQIITIVIDEKGDSTVDLEGFQGKGCGAIQEAFAKAVGTSTHVDHKREFNAPVIAANRLKQGK
jgi:hypothetical protein